MDVIEFIRLSRWMEENVQPATIVYEQLASALENNAQSSAKVPVRPHLEAVKSALLSMPVEQLSFQQADILQNLQVLPLLGKKGWKYIDELLKARTFDPSSVATDFRQSWTKINNSIRLLREAKDSLVPVGFNAELADEEYNRVTIRIRFTESAGISNVTQLKKWAAEWYEISRGLAMVAGERPEDIEVKGATTGSLILVLGTSIIVTTTVAVIMKQIASTVKSAAEVAHILQDWKMRKVADEEVERVLTERKKRIESEGVDTALQDIKIRLEENIQAETESAVRKSIEKMFSFAAKGGEVDLIPPANIEQHAAATMDMVDAIRLGSGPIDHPLAA